jgi:hypothetical protein
MRERVQSVGAYGGTPSVQNAILQMETRHPATWAQIDAPLRNTDVLHIWEAGQRQNPIDRALTILATAFSDEEQDDLTTLPIGVRDSRLLLVREATFGSNLNCIATCPTCGGATELALDTSELQAVMAPPATVSGWQTLNIDDLEINFRLPDSRDLADALRIGDPSTAQQRLIERCLHDARKDGTPATPPSEIFDRISEEMAMLDPGAELNLALSCPSCEHEWQSPFDMSAFLWIEIDALAKRLLREVATLAHAYGWREADILAMNAGRRQAYLDQM